MSAPIVQPSAYGFAQAIEPADRPEKTAQERADEQAASFWREDELRELLGQEWLRWFIEKQLFGMRMTRPRKFNPFSGSRQVMEAGFDRAIVDRAFDQIREIHALLPKR